MNKLPEASTTKAGLVTTEAQSFAGNKTVIGTLTVGPASGSATHTFQSSGNTILTINSSGSSGDLVFRRSGASPGSNAISGSAGNLIFSTGGSDPDTPFATNVGSISTAGAWTLGPSGYASYHNINGGCNVIVNHTATTTALDIKKALNSTATTNDFLKFGINDTYGNSGRIAANGANAAAFQTTSDGRLKTNIQNLLNGLDKIASLRPVTFEWLSHPGELSIGFIAQEVEPIIPEATSMQEDGYYSMCRENFIPYLVLAIKELKARVEALENT